MGIRVPVLLEILLVEPIVVLIGKDVLALDVKVVLLGDMLVLQG